MAENSLIEWTHHTFNPWRGCTKVSDGCKFCYAETLSKRNPKVLGQWGPSGTRVIASEAYWREPIKWNGKAKASGNRHRVFCASLADVGEGPETMPVASWLPVQMARVRLSKLVMECDSLDFLLLTKRPENMTKWFDPVVLNRCWIGTSVENQEAADKRIPHLLKCPAAVRFLSMEPLLGPVNLAKLYGECGYYCDESVGHVDHQREPADWIIVGCESGPSAREMKPEWAESIRDQCKSAGVAFFMKQMQVNGKVTGDLSDFPEYLRVREFASPITAKGAA